MATPDNTYTLHPPTRSMDVESTYKFMYELWNRSGGYKQSTTDLKGLTASVQELNTLNGIDVSETVQNQLDSKQSVAGLGDMAYQTSSSVAITGGSVNGVTMNGVTISGASTFTGDISLSSFSGGTIDDSVVTFPTGGLSTVIKPSGKINVNTVAVSNTDATENDLISYAMPADVLDNDDYYLEIVASGTVAANANNKRIRLYFGSTVILDTTAVAANAGSWEIRATAIRTSSSTEKVSCSIISDNSLIVDSSTYTLVSEDTTSPITIKCTGLGVSAGDITQEFLIVNLFN